ncbi:MAG TPA: 30S ribosomal protein S16 [Candidatus Magasanikbacteria bacterium]|nr:30S ribosomal protein S16 [Candidatus Magasanikbacteria bacterium]
MLAIRLQRVGKAKYPTYRLIVSEKARDTQDKYVELLGTHNPHNKENGFLPKTDRIKYWLEKGAVPSPTVHNLLLKNKIIGGKPMKSVFLSKKRQTKLAEKKKNAEAK